MGANDVTAPSAGDPALASWAALVAGALSPYGCVLVRTADQTISDVTDTAVTFPSGSVTEELDTDSFHDTGSNTARITIPTGGDGWYDIVGIVEFAANATGQRSVWVEDTGTEIPGARVTSQGFATTNNRRLVACSRLLSAGDYVTLNVRQNSTGNLAIKADGIRFQCLRRWPT